MFQLHDLPSRVRRIVKEFRECLFFAAFVHEIHDEIHAVVVGECQRFLHEDRRIVEDLRARRARQGFLFHSFH